MPDKRPSREEKLKLVDIAIHRAKEEACPYCKGLDIGYCGWAERSQRLEITTGEQRIGEPARVSDRDFHPDLPVEYDEFRTVVCLNCGFTKFFRFPPF